MSKTVTRKAAVRDPVPVEQPHLSVLPPEIVHMIMRMLGTDREALSACALATREFTFAALCCLGRHLTMNTVRRLRECVRLLTKGSAFQHIRSLDLGVTTKWVVRQRDWDHYLIILEAFARRRTLTRLWFTEVPFHFSGGRNKERVRDIITSLSATVNNLGLYSCSFSCYTEIVSLIKAFPLCTSLYVRDCVTRRTQGPNAFAEFPQHTPDTSDLELTSTSGHRSLIDVSTLVKDTALIISSLTDFSCGTGDANSTRHTLMAAAASPIERLQLVCGEPEGFHVLADPAVVAWPLTSLIIGPLIEKDDWWCERALRLNPSLPYLEDITIQSWHKTPVRYRLQFWTRMNQLLSRKDAFPHLNRLDFCIKVGSRRLQYMGQLGIMRNLSTLSGAGKVYFWGRKRELVPAPSMAQFNGDASSDA